MGIRSVSDDDFLTTKEACDRLGIAPVRLHRLVRSGDLQVVSNSAGKKGFSRAAVDAVLESGVELGPSGPPSTKGLLRRAGRRIVEFGTEGFFDSLG